MDLNKQKRLDMRRTPGLPSQGYGPDADEARDPLDTQSGILAETGFNFTSMGGFWSDYQDKKCRQENAEPANLALDPPDDVEYAWDDVNKRLVCRSGFGDWEPVKGALS